MTEILKISAKTFPKSVYIKTILAWNETSEWFLCEFPAVPVNIYFAYARHFVAYAKIFNPFNEAEECVFRSRIHSTSVFQKWYFFLSLTFRPLSLYLLTNDSAWVALNLIYTISIAVCVKIDRFFLRDLRNCIRRLALFRHGKFNINFLKSFKKCFITP